ncbi:MAG: polyamine aminopropyltransferase [Deltaproteobacteria bacterium]|nr:polyamine aminopropyltransferase [Deltaproteobacteria bacterium]
MSGMWYDETFNDRVRFGLRVKETLFRQQSDYQLVEIFDTFELGPTLTIDGIYMTSVGDEFHYHEMIAHPALTTAREVSRVLVIGGGDGGTAREALRHPEVDKLTMVEIDGVVVEASKKHLPEGFGSWDDPRFELIIGDGIKYVAEAAENSFDVVLLDGSDPVGPAKGLFDESFYRNVHRILKPTGVFALQSESPTFLEDVFLEIQRTLRKIFNNVRPYFGPVPIYAAGPWSWTYASDQADPLDIIDARAERVEAVTKQYNRDVHRGAFALPNRFRKELG